MSTLALVKDLRNVSFLCKMAFQLPFLTKGVNNPRYLPDGSSSAQLKVSDLSFSSSRASA